MIDYEVVWVISLFGGLWFVLSALDKKFNFGLNEDHDCAQSNAKNEVNELRSRVQVLEQIVTDPAHQLREAFKKL